MLTAATQRGPSCSSSPGRQARTPFGTQQGPKVLHVARARGKAREAAQQDDAESDAEESTPATHSRSGAPADTPHLIAEARAAAIGLSPKEFRSKMKELRLLMPGITGPKLLSLDQDCLMELIADTGSVANRLVELRTRFPAGDPQRPGRARSKQQLLYADPELLTSSHWEAFLRHLPLAVFHGHTGAVSSVAITPDSRRAVSGSYDGTLRVWDLESHTCVATLQGHSGAVTSVAVTPDGCHAVSGSYDGTLRVWDLHDRACAACLEGHTGLVLSVAVTPDGQRVVSGGEDSSVRVWDLQSHAQVALLQTAGQRRRVFRYSSLAVSPDGRLLVAGSREGCLSIWDLEADGFVAAVAPPPQLSKHASGVRSVAVTPDGRHAVVARREPTPQLLDLHTLSLDSSFQPPCSDTCSGPVAVTPDGRWAVTGSGESLAAWDLGTGCFTDHTPQFGQSLIGHAEGVAALAISPDGRGAVSGSLDNSLRLWDLSAVLGSQPA